MVCDGKDDTACTKAACDPKDGQCKPTPVADYCWQASCASGQITCTCTSDADCAGKDDGNLCNGTLFCDKTSGKCLPNPASIQLCPSAQDTACAKNACDPTDGKCDQCEGTACKSGTKTCACKKDSDCVDVDGDVCNGVPYRDLKSGECKPNAASAVVCSKKDDWACEAVACHPKTGLCQLAPKNDGGCCDDGNPCTEGDVCKTGARGSLPWVLRTGPWGHGDCTTLGGCGAQSEASCDDANPCTADSCNAATGACLHLPVSGALCGAGKVCSAGACVVQ